MQMPYTAGFFSLSSRLPCALFRAAAYHLSAVMLKYMRHVQPVNSATAAVAAAADAKLHRGSSRGSNNNSGQQRVQQCSRRRCRRSFGAVSWVLGSRRSVSSCWLSRSCARTEKNGTPQLHFQLQFLYIFLESPDFWVVPPPPPVKCVRFSQTTTKTKTKQLPNRVQDTTYNQF